LIKKNIFKHWNSIFNKINIFHTKSTK